MDSIHLLSNAPVTRSARLHISHVYSTLASMMLVTLVTVYFDLGPRLFPWFRGWAAAAGLVGILMAFQAFPRDKQYLGLRRALLFSFALGKGLSLSPFVTNLGFVSDRIVSQAALATFLLFTSFSLAALYAHRRTIIYTLGALGTLTSVSFAAVVSKYVFGISVSLTTELVLGLLLASLYLICDTQLMIYRASFVNLVDPITKDHLQLDHAAELYMDLVQMFVHLAMLLVNQHDENDDDGRRRTAKSRRR